MSHPSFAAGPDSGGPTGPAAPAAIRPGQGAHPVLAPLLDLDPDLGRGLSPALRAQARPWLVVRLEPMRRGEWPVLGGEEDGMLGLLVLQGLLARSVTVGGGAHPELIGRGDVLRPWQRDINDRLVPIGTRWHVVEPALVAVLDRRFAGLVGRWPEVLNELMGRAIGRIQELEVNLAIAQIPQLELRLLALLWRFADRWGEPCADGVLVPVRLTHSLLAGLALARRPSVTKALAELTLRGLVSRREEGWVVHGEPPAELQALAGREPARGGGEG
jgi:CRP/FNR family transcriptional regulator, cyclic AMP receptor protein